MLVTSPNCTTTGIAMPLKPLHDAFGIKEVFAVSMQAVSGAGYPGISYLDIEDNVIPFIGGEEQKIETETHLLLGKMNGSSRIPAQMTISAQANRVSVAKAILYACRSSWIKKHHWKRSFLPLEISREWMDCRICPAYPKQILIVRDEDERPQPRRDRTCQQRHVYFCWPHPPLPDPGLPHGDCLPQHIAWRCKRINS